MRTEHPFLAPAHEGALATAALRSTGSLKGSGSLSADSVDLLGVLRASQALSSQTSLDRLTAQVTEVLETLTGATRVRLLSWVQDQWLLLAPEPGREPLGLAEAASLRMVPAAAVRYAERIGEPLVVDDVAADDRFARDAYFRGLVHCSLMVVPIASAGGARAMLVLENTRVPGAFHAGRLDAVMLVAGQLAVSLANAQLYEHLEERVRSRTRELERVQVQLVDNARRAGKAEIAANVLHNVGNVLNSVNVSAEVVRRTVANSRVGGLARAVALLNEHAADLGGFLVRDERGRQLRPYLGELVDALAEERRQVLEELDRLARSVEHIKHVVATQQSHTGPSSVIEMVSPHEVLSEARRLSAEALERHAVKVTMDCELTEPLALDKPRLLQILVNLIRNGAQAMDEAAPEHRVLRLGTEMRPGVETGRSLCILVQDSGKGIAPENLTRIFAHGFTTKADGKGFGLHASALSALEMGGRLTVHSEGPGRGALFVVELPVS